MILDTCFFIDFLKGDKGAIEFLKNNLLEDLKISAVSVFELHKCDFSPKKESLVANFLDRFIFVNLDQRASMKGGKIFLNLRKVGLSIDSEDCLISATALALRESVVTRNTKHFSRIKDLDVISY